MDSVGCSVSRRGTTVGVPVDMFCGKGGGARDTDAAVGIARNAVAAGGGVRDADAAVGVARNAVAAGGGRRNADVAVGVARNAVTAGGGTRSADAAVGAARNATAGENAPSGFATVLSVLLADNAGPARPPALP